MDIFDSALSRPGDLGRHQKHFHGYFTFPKLEGQISPHMTFRGEEVLVWSLNNYLGLANHPEVREADARSAKEWGLGYPMGARVMSGQTAKHEELEQKLADFVGQEKGYLLNYGYQGMVSIVDAMLGRNDVAVYDSESHACIIDGLRMHIGKRYVYSHNDMESLETQLKRATTWAEKSGGGVLVITEGVFGMGGDIGKLDEIVALKKKYQFRLLVDDAHGLGTMGKTGAGVGEHLGVESEVDIYFGTFAKSFAAVGAFVATRADICAFLQYSMRSQIFAKSLPMPLVEGLLKRLELVKSRPDLKDKLWEITNALQGGLRKEGFNLGATNSPVTPVYLSGEVVEAMNMIRDLRENFGVFCSGVMYPVIPKGQILLRLIPTATHTLDDVAKTIDSFSQIKDKLMQGVYKQQAI